MDSPGSPSEHSVRLTVNGRKTEVRVEARTLLSECIRDTLGLTGTHVGCDTSQCGACAVLLDGRAVKSCTVFAVQADGSEIVTIEGLRDLVPASDRIDGLHPLQAAFWNHHGLQCGFCTPGILMGAVDFLAEHPEPSDEEIRHALDGHLCRCTGYQTIVHALRDAARALLERPHAVTAESLSSAGGEG